MKKILLLGLLVLVLACAGCVTHDTREMIYATDSNGKVILDAKGAPMIVGEKRGTTDVEMEAVKYQGQAATKLAEQAPQLKTELKAPILMMTAEGKLATLTDGKGNVVYISACTMDSGVMAAITGTAITNEHSSQGVKIAGKIFKFGEKALNPLATAFTIDRVVRFGTGSDNRKTYDNSFNNATQSPQSVDNVGANTSNTPTDSHNTSTSTTTENTTNQVAESEVETEPEP